MAADTSARAAGLGRLEVCCGRRCAKSARELRTSSEGITARLCAAHPARREIGSRRDLPMGAARQGRVGRLRPKPPPYHTRPEAGISGAPRRSLALSIAAGVLGESRCMPNASRGQPRDSGTPGACAPGPGGSQPRAERRGPGSWPTCEGGCQATEQGEPHLVKHTKLPNLNPSAGQQGAFLGRRATDTPRCATKADSPSPKRGTCRE